MTKENNQKTVLRPDGGDPEESGETLEGHTHDDHRNPTKSARNRRNASNGSSSDSEVADVSGEIHGIFSSNLTRQAQREEEYREITEQFETEAAEENDDPDEWFNEAIATGQEDVESFDQDISTTHYTEDSDFVEEEVGLLSYMQRQADEINDLDSLVDHWVGIYNDLDQREEDLKGRKDDVDQQVDEMIKDNPEGDYTELLEKELDDVEREIEEELPEIKDRKKRAREKKQGHVSERGNRVDEVREVHEQYAEDVEEYVEERTDQLSDVLTVLEATKRNAEAYEERSVENNFEGGAELDQAQQELAQNNEQAAVAYANKARRILEELEGTVSDYERVTSEMTDKVEDRTEEIESVYEDLTPEDYDGDEDLAAIGSRVTNMLEEVTGEEHSYDDLARLAEGLNRRPE